MGKSGKCHLMAGKLAGNEINVYGKKITLLRLSDKFIDTYPIFQVRVYRTIGPLVST